MVECKCCVKDLQFIKCPLCKSATKLYEACKALIEELKDIPMITSSPAIRQGEQVLAEVEKNDTG